MSIDTTNSNLKMILSEKNQIVNVYSLDYFAGKVY